MSDNKNNNEMDHEYDGIKECDNPLPNWWLITFYGAILFGIGYFFYYQMGNGPTLAEEFKESQGAHSKVRENYLEKLKEFDLAKFEELYKNPATIQYGESIFATNCQACHAEGGKGDIGPNLIDDYWLFSLGTPESIYPFLLAGSQGTGMPSWSDKMEKDELLAVLAYVLSQQGKTYEGAKESEGNQWSAWYPGMPPRF